MSKSLRVRVAVVSMLAALGALAAGSSASAQVTVGQTIPPGGEYHPCVFSEAYDELQYSIAAGNSYVVPTAGVLTSWSTNVGPSAGQVFGFKVFRPLGGSQNQTVGLDGPRLLAPGINTFPISIPVLPGDVVGVVLGPNTEADCAFETGLMGDEVRYRVGNGAVGEVGDFGGSFSKARLNVSATLLPPPAIGSLGPAKGSIKGESVTIAGANFAGVSAVTFGGVPAKSFTVDSEAQITAVAPASKKLSKVPVSVTTIAGVGTGAQTYAYEGCKVPQLKGKRLKGSRKAAGRADCKIGKVTKLEGATGKTGEVTKQHPKPGKVLAPDTKIKVTLNP